MHLVNLSRRSWCTVTVSHPTPFTDSNTRWCEMRRTRVCLRDGDSNCTVKLPTLLRRDFRSWKRASRKSWHTISLKQECLTSRPTTGSRLATTPLAAQQMLKPSTISDEG